MRVAAAHHLLGVRLKGERAQLALHEPLHGAVGVGLEVARAERFLLAEALEQLVRREAGRRRRHHPRPGRRQRALELDLRGRLLRAPHDVRQRAAARPDLREEVAHVLEEERAGLGIALFVAEAGAEEQRALGS